MNERKLLNLASIIFVGAICVLMFANLGSLMFIKGISLFSIDSPLAYVFLIAVALLICIIATITKGIYGNNTDQEAKTENSDDKYGEIKNIVIFAVVLFVYVQALKLLHFNIGTIVFMSLTMFFLNGQKGKAGLKLFKAIAATVITVPIIYLVFNGVFNVVLP